MQRGLRAVLTLLAALALCPTQPLCAEPVDSAEYQVFQIRHKQATDIEKMLVELLAKFGPSTHVVSDSRKNQILLRGPERSQQIARQLINSVDFPSKSAVNREPHVRAYACPPERLSETARLLEARFKDHSELRIAADRSSDRLLVLADGQTHAAISRWLDHGGLQAPHAETPRRLSNSLPPPASKSGVMREEYLPLLTSRIDRIESTLRKVFGTQIRQEAAGTGIEEAAFSIVTDSGEILRIRFDRGRRGLRVYGTESMRSEFAQLIAALDNPLPAAGRKVRIVPVRRSDPNKLRLAIEAYRDGYRVIDRPGRSVDDGRGAGDSERRERGPVSPLDGQGAYRTLTSRDPIELAAFLESTAGSPNEGPAESMPAGEEPLPEPELSDEERRRLRELAADVEIETLEDLDVIILRGSNRDVEEVTRIIREIERLSAETEPVIEVHPLKHVRGESVSELVAAIKEDLVGRLQGRVTVTPLMKPNALLLIGWGSAVEAVKELISQLDQPVPPRSQFRVFRLRHAPAASAATAVREFFANRTGLGPKVQVSHDVRTNSLMVEAAPRDMQEVAELIRSLDSGESQAVKQTRVFHLKNSLAADLAEVLRAAIEAASNRGGADAGKSAVLELLTIDAEGERILKSGILNDVSITPDPRRNALLVTAPAESMDLLDALIGQLDETPAAEAQIKVFRIVNGDATDLVQMLRALLPTQTTPGALPQLPGAQGETSLAPLTFAVDVRTNSIIATGSTGDLKIIEALLLRLDEKEMQQRRNTVYRLKNSPAIDVARAINDFLRSEQQVQEAAPGVISPFDQIEREVVVVPEEVSNSLIISATPRFFEEITRLVEELDAQPPQVMIQVLIAEVTLNNTDEFGVELGIQDSILFDRSLLGDLVTTTNTIQQSTDQGILTSTEEIIQAATNTPGFAFNNQPLGNSGSDRALGTSDTLAGQALSNFAVGRVNNELGFGGLVLSASSESVSVLIRALQESRRLDVLSRPQIMTLDNQPAFIQVGQRVPRIVGSTINQLGQVNTIALENVGLILGVTPRISPDGMVVMEIDAEKSALGPEQEGIPISVSTDGTVIRSPRIDLTTAQTTVSAASGETIVLGGLITKSRSEVSRRVPYLADIPLLGHLFRFDGLSHRRTELLIIMTPHVIRSAADAALIKQQEAARMHWCASDVHEIHGVADFCQCGNCPVCDRQIPVIYPDLNPRGIVPPQGDPGAAPYAPEAMPMPDSREPQWQPPLEFPESPGGSDRFEVPPSPGEARLWDTSRPGNTELSSRTPSQFRQTATAANSVSHTSTGVVGAYFEPSSWLDDSSPEAAGGVVPAAQNVLPTGEPAGSLPGTRSDSLDSARIEGTQIPRSKNKKKRRRLLSVPEWWR